MNRKTKFTVLAWVLIFIAYNLFFYSIFFTFVTPLFGMGGLQSSTQPTPESYFLALIIGEIGLIVALIAVLTKSPTS